MNVSQMLTGYAFGTIKPQINVQPAPAKEPKTCSDETRKTLDAGRATRKAKADKRRAAMVEMITAGATVLEVAEHFRVCVDTVICDLSILRETAISAVLADAFAATTPTIKPLKNGHRRETIEKKRKILASIRRKPLTVYELADRYCMSRICMLKYLGELEAEGHICRTDDWPRKYQPTKEKAA